MTAGAAESTARNGNAALADACCDLAVVLPLVPGRSSINHDHRRITRHVGTER
jgi:hypothetical protein